MTTYNYPTVTDETKLEPKYKRSNPILKFLRLSNKEHVTASQGYVIKRNDMHGKPRSTKTYSSEKPGAITGVEYYYRSKRAYNPCPSAYSYYSVPNELNNESVPVINSDGTHTTSKLGVDIEMVVDMREHETQTDGFIPQGNLDAFVLAIFPAFPFTLWFQKTHEQTRFRSAVATKVVDTYAILERTVAIDNGARVETKNLAYDAETGEILVSQTENEFKDDLYSLAQPAHWAYSGMGQAYKNIGLEVRNQSLTNLSQAPNWFHAGDELLLDSAGIIKKGWVLEVDPTNIDVVDEQGAVVKPGPFDRILVTRSGRRNLQSISIGSISSQKNPLSYTNVGDLDDEIIGAGAIEYSDHWQTFCGDYRCGCSNSASSNSSYLKNMLDSLARGNRFVEHETDITPCVFSYNLAPQAGSKNSIAVNAPPSSYWQSGSLIGSEDLTALTFDKQNSSYYGFGTCGGTTNFHVFGHHTTWGPTTITNGLKKTYTDFGVWGAAYDNINQKLYVAGIATTVPSPNPYGIKFGQHLYEVNTTNGNLTYKAPLETGSVTSLSSTDCKAPYHGLVNAMAYNEQDGKLYAILRDWDNYYSNTGGVTNSLVIFDPATGIPDPGGNGIVSIPNFNSIAKYAFKGYDFTGLDFEPQFNRLIAAQEDDGKLFYLPINGGASTFAQFSTPGSTQALTPIEVGVGPGFDYLSCLAFLPTNLCSSSQSYCSNNIFIRLTNSCNATTFPAPAAQPAYGGSSVCATKGAQAATIRVVDPCADSCEIGLFIPDPAYSFQKVDSVIEIGLYPDPENSCSPSGSFWVKAVTTNSGVTDTFLINGYTQCFPIMDFDIPLSAGSTVNPYCEGIKGNWRSLRSHAYFTERTAQNAIASSATDIRNEGFYTQFHPFWQAGSPWQANYNNWTWASEVTQTTPYGQELENRDALDRYSAAIFGYGHQLPIAIAGNAHSYEIANANFEIEDDVIKDCNVHTYFEPRLLELTDTFTLSNERAHSGYRSAKLPQDGYITGYYGLTASDSSNSGSGVPYVIDEKDCQGVFKPIIGKRYVASVWVSEASYYTDSSPRFNFPDQGIEVFIDGFQVFTFVSEKRSKIIEGWQQIEVIFDIPSIAQNEVEIRLTNSGNGACYFDDFRVHPYDASMQTHVYDPLTQRLLASGDPNNYMLFYSYDHEGKLIGTKVETNRGMKSLNEVRYHATKP